VKENTNHKNQSHFKSQIAALSTRFVLLTLSLHPTQVSSILRIFRYRRKTLCRLFLS